MKSQDSWGWAGPQSPCSFALLDTGKDWPRVSQVGQSQSDFMTGGLEAEPWRLLEARPPLSTLGLGRWSLPWIQEVGWRVGGLQTWFAGQAGQGPPPLCWGSVSSESDGWSESPGQGKPRPLTLCSFTWSVPSSAGRVRGRPDCRRSWMLQRQPTHHEHALCGPEHA